MGNSNRNRRGPQFILGLLGIGVIAALIVHIMVGGTDNFWPWQIIREIFRGHLPAQDSTEINTVVWAIRLPRALECVFVGGILGLVGSAFQAQLRNPLAEPYIVGVSSGAAIGSAIAMILGFDAWFGGLGSAAFGFVTGMISLSIVYGLASRRGVVDVTTLLLAGVVVGSLMASLLSLCLLLARQDTNKVLQWLLGNMGTANFEKDALLMVALIIGSIILIRQTRLLNAFAIGEDAALRMGVDVGRLRATVLIVGTAMTATAVGIVGIVGFLGLVAPHISRRVLGVDWRYSLMGSGLIGAILLLGSDLLAQRIGSLFGTVIGDIPVGIVTAVIGAPSLLILIRKRG